MCDVLADTPPTVVRLGVVFCVKLLNVIPTVLVAVVVFEVLVGDTIADTRGGVVEVVVKVQVVTFVEAIFSFTTSVTGPHSPALEDSSAVF